MTYVAVKIQDKEVEIKVRAGRGDDESELNFDGKSRKTLLLTSLIGGFTSGAFGLGGGSIYNPILIEMGVPPTVASATGMYMVMLSSIATTTMFLVFGELDLSYSIWLCFWSCLATSLALKSITAYIKRTNRASIIVYLMTAMLGLSALLVPFFGWKEAIQESERGRDFLKFKDICK